jgi:glucose-6-phosphate 1-dehydrogenase
LHEVFAESDLFRIDHYLGKEAVQNLVVFRFANRIFEPIWNRDHISCVQITMAERFGIKGRGALYEELGAVRDVVQNHLLQLLAILTMEPAASTRHESIRDEVAAVLKCVKPIAPSAVVRGQFRGYRDEPGVKKDSNVETFAAVHLEIDTPRWQGVPFFIRAGKSLPVTVTEVMIDFREAPLNECASGPCNHLRLRVGPEVVIALTTEVKKPGEGLIGEPVELTFMHHANKNEMTAYERLLGDAMMGDPTLFAREDAVEAAWAIVDPIVGDQRDVELYEPGSWGPPDANRLTSSFGGWHNPKAEPDQPPDEAPA